MNLLDKVPVTRRRPRISQVDDPVAKLHRQLPNLEVFIAPGDSHGQRDNNAVTRKPRGSTGKDKNHATSAILQPVGVPVMTTTEPLNP